MEKKTKLTGAQAIVKYLIHERVPYVLGIFGHGNVQLGEALAEEKDKITYIQVKNEQNAVHIATAYAKMTGRPLAVTSSIGPGCTNLVTGAAVAHANRLPVILLPGDAFSDAVGPVLQQIEGNPDAECRAADTLKPVSRYWMRVNRAKQLQKVLPQLFDAILTPGMEGPGTLALPMDVQAEAADFDLEMFLKPRAQYWQRTFPDPLAVKTAVEEIKNAKRPLIIAGGGVIYSHAWAWLEIFAELIGAPVVATQSGNGALLFDHPFYAFSGIGPTGNPCTNTLARKADLIIGVGTRYTDFITESETAFRRDAVFININVAHVDIGKQRAIKLLGDAQSTLVELVREIWIRRACPDPETRIAYEKELQSLKKKWIREQDRFRDYNGEKLVQPEVIGILNEACGPIDVVINAAGGMPGDLQKFWRPKDPTRKGYHLEYGYSCMGYEIPAGIGVKLADPRREVWVLVGDGSALMGGLSELHTAYQYGIKVNVIVVDNHGYQCIRGLQRGQGFQEFGNEFRVFEKGKNNLTGERTLIKFANIARELGAVSITANSREAFRAAIEAARNIPGIQPTLIHVLVDPEFSTPGYGWWDVPIPEVSDRPELKRALRRYRAKKTTQTIR